MNMYRVMFYKEAEYVGGILLAAMSESHALDVSLLDCMSTKQYAGSEYTVEVKRVR